MLILIKMCWVHHEIFTITHYILVNIGIDNLFSCFQHCGF